MTPTEQIVIPSPAVEPFDPAQFLSCRACNLQIGWWSSVRGWLKGMQQNISGVKFCAGGKAPTENRGLMSAMMTGEVEAFNPCAGITDPHLHVRCNQCGFSYLMHPRTPNVKAS